MKASMMRNLAVALALVAGLSGATVASAQSNWNGNVGSSQRNWRGANLTGVWQLQSSDVGPGRSGWNSGNQGSGRGRGMTPATLRIEQHGRFVTVANEQGRALGQARVRGNARRLTEVKIDRTGRNGAQISEVFTLRNRGQLEVHMTVTSARGSRTFTSLYNRA